MTKDDFIFNLKRCGCLYKDGNTYYEENELIECFEDVGAFNQPHVTPQEPKTGHWIKGKCDQCGGYAPFWPMASTYHRSKYCPNCGAKMEVEK